jgi:predicted permease
MSPLRQAWRQLKARPGVTFVAACTLGLGIAVNTVVFSGVYTLLLQDLPYPDADRLVVLGQRAAGNNEEGLALGDLAPWKRENPIFEELSAAAWWGVNLAEVSVSSRVPAERVTGALVTEELFPMLGGRALIGRTPAPADFEAGAARVVVLSRELWQRRFAGDASIVGGEVLLDGEGHIVIGVMPDDFRFPFWASLWVPVSAGERAEALAGGSPDWTVLARLSPGIDAERARSELVPWLARSAAARGERADTRRPTVTPLRDVRAPRFRQAAVVAQVVVGLVLLIACANLAGLLLARGEERRMELTIRRALGAGTPRMVAQLLTEAAALGLVGCALGILGAYWGFRFLTSAVSWPAIGVTEPTLNLPVLASALVLSLVTSVVAGLGPALHVTRQDLTSSLVAGALTTTQSPSGRRRGGWLAAVQLALATALLVSAGLAVRALADLALEDPGFATDGAIVLTVSTPASKSDFDEAGYLDRLLEVIAGVPGVEAVGTAGYMPLVGYNPGVTLRDAGEAAAETHVDFQPVSPGYLGAMGIPILRGRALEARDRGSAPVALVNQALVRQLWPGIDVLGRVIRLPEHSGETPVTVVGVVGDVRQFGLRAEPRSEVYVLGYRESLSTVVVRCGPRTRAVAAALREELARRQGDGVAFRLGTMSEFLAAHLERRRVFVRLLLSFSIIALGLAALGIYGMSAYRVARRGREFGIRKALGARRADVLRLVLSETLRVSAAGVALGLVLSIGLTAAIRRAVSGIGAADPLLGAALALLIVAIATAASYSPALRAARADPATILRGE